MDWQDEGAILSVRPHGESSAIVEVMSDVGINSDVDGHGAIEHALKRIDYVRLQVRLEDIAGEFVRRRDRNRLAVDELRDR